MTKSKPVLLITELWMLKIFYKNFSENVNLKEIIKSKENHLKNKISTLKNLF